MKKSWNYLLGTLTLVLALVATMVANPKDTRLTIIACDVGQGDALVVMYGTTQILFDGGLPNGRVVNCLSKYMPFWDRKVEVIVLSHPQLDHYGGLIEVVKRYEVELFVANSLDSGSSEYTALKNEVVARGIKVLNPTDTTDLRLGGIYLDILWPTDEFIAQNSLSQNTAHSKDTKNILGASTTTLDPNHFSIVALLRLDDFTALFTGDISPKDSNGIAEMLTQKKIDRVEYIKIPHHGSKNGVSRKLLEATSPEVAVISAGKNNRYGHPHKEVLDMLNDLNIKTRVTKDEGDVVYKY